MRSPIRILLLAAVPVLVLGLSACTQPAPLPAPSRSAVSPSPTPTPGLDVGAIAGLARRAAGSGTVVAIEDESDGTSFEAHVIDVTGAQQELHLAPTGEVRSGPTTDQTTVDQRSANRGLVAAASVGVAGAADRMAEAVPGGEVTAIGLQEYRDRPTWVGDVTDAKGVRHDVRIDAVSGSVVMDRADQQQPSGGS